MKSIYAIKVYYGTYRPISNRKAKRLKHLINNKVYDYLDSSYILINFVSQGGQRSSLSASCYAEVAFDGEEDELVEELLENLPKPQLTKYERTIVVDKMACFKCRQIGTYKTKYIKKD